MTRPQKLEVKPALIQYRQITLSDLIQVLFWNNHHHDFSLCMVILHNYFTPVLTYPNLVKKHLETMKPNFEIKNELKYTIK